VAGDPPDAAHAFDGSTKSNLDSGRQTYRDLWWSKGDDVALREAVDALSKSEACNALFALLFDLRRVSSAPEDVI